MISISIPDWIEGATLNLKLVPDEFHLDEVLRFEGISILNDSSESVHFINFQYEGIIGRRLRCLYKFNDTTMIDPSKINRKTNH